MPPCAHAQAFGIRTAVAARLRSVRRITQACAVLPCRRVCCSCWVEASCLLVLLRGSVFCLVLLPCLLLQSPFYLSPWRWQVRTVADDVVPFSAHWVRYALCSLYATYSKTGRLPATAWHANKLSVGAAASTRGQRRAVSLAWRGNAPLPPHYPSSEHRRWLAASARTRCIARSRAFWNQRRSGRQPLFCL